MTPKKPAKVRRQKIAIPSTTSAAQGPGLSQDKQKPPLRSSSAADKPARRSAGTSAPRAGGSTTESLLTVEQRQAIQAMASQGLSKSTIAAALNIEGDWLGLEQLPEMRVGRVANVLFSDIEQIVGLKEGRKFPSVRGLSKKQAVITAFKACASITKACQAAKIKRNQHYNWLRDDPAYVEAFAAAQV